VQPNLLTQSEEFEFSALAQAHFYPRAILGEFLPFLHGSVVDVGAGIGQLTELLALAVGPKNIRALEPDPRFAKRFRSRLPHLQLLEKTASSMPNETTCDTVTSINVLEHIEDDVSELKHYHKWLAPSHGCLCLLVPARAELFSSIDKDFGHFRRYSKPSLTEILTKAGFAVHRLFYFNFAGYFAWALNFKFLGLRNFEPGKVVFFDRKIFRWCHLLERGLCRPPWGQSLIAIGQAG